MKYNFDKLSERRHTHSEKWNVKDNELPMWVADMDFMVMPEIQEAVKNAATDGSKRTYWGSGVSPDNAKKGPAIPRKPLRRGQ